ncbi:MAG: hypothetical protein EBY57_08160 [Actinobacteria bacterium]|nr:hypothetical protein [Actinomycetota bacterium]
MISTDPDVDPRKCAVAIACAAEAVTSGHDVDVFFASHAVQLLQGQFIDGLDDRVGMPPGTCRTMMQTLIDGAKIACSTGSQAVVGVTPSSMCNHLAITRLHSMTRMMSMKSCIGTNSAR